MGNKDTNQSISNKKYDDDPFGLHRDEKIRKHLFFLWMYVASEGLCEKAMDFIFESMEKSIDFDFGYGIY